MATIIGTEEADFRTGTTTFDVIRGLDGADALFGRGGDDIMTYESGPRLPWRSWQ